MPQANNLSDALKNLSLKALDDGRFDDFWVNTDESRGEYPAKSLELAYLETPTGTLQTLFSGYRGSGKSTELQRLKRELEKKNFVALTVSVATELDQYQFSVSELMIALMKQVFEWAKDYELEFEKSYLQPILDWTQTLVKEELIEKSFSLGAGGDTKSILKKLALDFADLTLMGKIDQKYKTTIRQESSPMLSELIKSSNIFLNEIRQRLRHNDQGFLVMIEDLDKVNLNLSENLFLRYAASLKSMNANVLYTFPIALMSHAQYKSITLTFDQHFVLPMIKTHNRQGEPLMENGQDMLRLIVEKRMDLSLFASPNLLNKLIAYSGGVLFDLFRMIRDAISYAQIFGTTKLDEKACDKAINSALRDYRSTIAETETIPVEVFWKELKDLVEAGTGQPSNTHAVMILRQNLCILGYNSEDWNAVHPMVRELQIQRGEIDEKYRVRVS